jgi:hypothetical protein
LRAAAPGYELRLAQRRVIDRFMRTRNIPRQGYLSEIDTLLPFAPIQGNDCSCQRGETKQSHPIISATFANDYLE